MIANLKTMHDRSEAGQALIEAVVAIPIVLLVISCMFDVGRAVALEQNLKSAAASVAAAVEADPDMSETVAQGLVDRNYPQIETATVHLDGPQRIEEDVDYKIYNAAAGSFKSRPSHVGRDTYGVVLTYEGSWASPALRALSFASGREGGFALEAEATAIVDVTGEVW